MKRRVFLSMGALAAAGTAGYLGYRRFGQTAPSLSDVAYGPGERQTYDVYLPEGPGPFPFVFEIHGGAFLMGSKTANPVSSTLLQSGIAIVRTNYRLSGTDLWPAQLDDCLAALAHVRAHAADQGLRADAFATWGQSAGGFLAVSTALSLIEAGDPPRAVVDFYGPMDFATMDADLSALGRSPVMGATDAADSPESALLGFPIGENRAAATAMGPIGRLAGMKGRPLPPLFVRHGDADPMIAHLQSERLVAAWAAVDPAAPVDFALVPGAGHGGDAFDAEAVMAPLRDFLASRLSD